MKARIMLISWLAVMLFVPLALSQTISGQAGQPQTELALVNPVNNTLTGTFIPATTIQDPNDPNAVISVPGACQFSLTLGANEQAVEARRTSDITVDDASNTCSAAFDIGQPQMEATPSPAEIADLADTSIASSGDTTTPTGSFTPDLGLTSNQVTSAGFLKTWFIGPSNDTENSVQDNTQWRWSGTGYCVTSLSGSDQLTWFRRDGWSVDTHSFQKTANCAETTDKSDVSFFALFFCYPNATFAGYHNAVHGMQNGNLVGTWNDYTIPNLGCKGSFLRLRAQLKRTQN